MNKKTVEKILPLIIIILFFPLMTKAFTLSRNLSVGSIGEDVRQLQIFLNNYSPLTKISSFGVGSPGSETNYFGSLTNLAVQKFQNINFEQILRPVNLLQGTGFVGPSTITFINSLNTVNTVVQNYTTPVITSISPEVVRDGDTITIEGRNFSEKNTITVTFEDRDKFTEIESTDNGTKIEFEFESKTQDIFKEKVSSRGQEAVVENLPETKLAVTVINEKGVQSNFKTINFKLK